VIRRLSLTFILAAIASPVAAQTTPPAPTGVEFLSRFDFRVSMEHIVSSDERFVWDANWGGDLDLLDYVAGRINFVANYQTILGSEFRAFDPNQGNYVLEGSASRRLGTAEIAGVYHHVSRHLSDRPKRQAVDWNMIGGRFRHASRAGRLALDERVDVRGVIQKSFVDYSWEVDGAARAVVRANSRLALVASGGAQVLGVDGTRDRGTQYGFRGEGGVRVDGGRASLDLFAAVERRIDPYQLEFNTETWLTMGFRLSSR
jgi:hypothetical protein